jgi:hypothetical protein
MKFIKNIRDKQIEFFVDKNSNTDTTVTVKIPPYGQFSRGDLYTSQELNNLIIEEMQGLIPLNNDGRFLADKKDYKDIVLYFEKKVKSLDPKTKDLTSADFSTVDKTSKRKKTIKTRNSSIKKNVTKKQ